MTLEHAILSVKSGSGPEFERAFRKAQPLIASQKGFVDLQLHRCVEEADKYLLLVRWQTLEDHTLGFRQSPEYLEWKRLLHHFYEPFPVVQHYAPVRL